MSIKVDFSGLPNVLRKYRNARNLTQKEAADLLGMSQVQYARYEKGESKLVTHHLQAIIDAFKIPLLEWVTGLGNQDDLLPVARNLAEELNNYIAIHTRQE